MCIYIYIIYICIYVYASSLNIQMSIYLIEWRAEAEELQLSRALGALIMTVWSGNYYVPKNINPAGFIAAVCSVALDSHSRVSPETAERFAAAVLDRRMSLPFRGEGGVTQQYWLKWQCYRRAVSTALFGPVEGQTPEERGNLPLPVDHWTARNIQRKKELPLVASALQRFQNLKPYVSSVIFIYNLHLARSTCQPRCRIDLWLSVCLCTYLFESIRIFMCGFTVAFVYVYVFLVVFVFCFTFAFEFVCMFIFVSIYIHGERERARNIYLHTYAFVYVCLYVGRQAAIRFLCTCIYKRI